MKKIIFESAQVYRGIINGYSIDFTYKYIVFQDGFLKDKEMIYVFRISISRYAMLSWKYDVEINDDNLLKKIAFPFAIESISERVKDGTIREFEERIISTEDNLLEYPFDIKKMKNINIEGYEISFEESIDIGTQIKSNKLADTIIEYRDNINALVYDKHKEILLKLAQERNILYLFRNISNKEQFMYAISTLANLSTDLNTELLRKITNNKDSNIKSLSLLDEFVKVIDNNEKEIIEIFKGINRIRQGFPIHSDKTDYIKNLKKFNIEYPVNDYNNAWAILLLNYSNALMKLLELTKTHTNNNNNN